MKQLRMFPDHPVEHPTARQKRHSGKTTWYFVRNAMNTQMRGEAGDGLGYDWFPLDLRNPCIMLFSTRCMAKHEARRSGGHVQKYPYNLDTLRS